MIRRLRIKFVCINMAIATGMLCVILGMVLHFTGEGLAAESLRGMQAAALEPMGPGQRRPGELRIPCFTLQLGPHGELIAKGSSYDLTDEAFLRQVLDAALATGEPAGLLREAGLRFCLAGPPERPVLVFADASGELAAMERLVETCLFIGCAGFLAFLGLSLLLARWAVRPVDMAWQQQRQFVADASHELKTPLTVILTNAELLQDGGADRDRFVKNILDMSRRMRTLVESLLELARVDGALAEDAMETVDFSRLVSDALLPFEPVFFEQGLRLESRLEEGLAVRGFPDRLRQLAGILLDNAQKYAAPRGWAEVYLRREGRWLLLSVSNAGEPIPQGMLEEIFKRFRRGEPSGTEGSGLGLSIAQGIVQTHRGRIWAESGDGVNTLHVRLPAAR